MNVIRSPYNLGQSDSCQACDHRAAGSFCELPASSLRALDSASYMTAYPSEALLFVEGQAPRGAFIVCHGQVKLSVIAEDGRTLILKIAGPGELLGVSACIAGRPYEVTAETLTPCSVNFIKLDDFRRLLRHDAEICLQVARQMSVQYQAACRELRWVGLSRSADWRLASLLLSWAEEPGAVSYKMTLTHEQLAQMIGTTRETVTRVLARFRKQGLVQQRGATLVLSNKPALQDIAGSGAIVPETHAAAAAGLSAAGSPERAGFARSGVPTARALRQPQTAPALV
jgi:CRP/FNR family cyclic AMP-dependent transcriptional regulator